MASSNGNSNEFVAALSGVGAPRALLVTLNNNGQLDYRPISHGQSVLNIKEDLMNHINDYPHTDEWLVSIRDQIDERLAARSIAGANGGVCIPRKSGGWNIAHINAFEPVTITEG